MKYKNQSSKSDKWNTADNGNKGNKWTLQEEQLLQQHFINGLNTAQIAIILQRSAGAIRSRLIKLGLVQKLT